MNSLKIRVSLLLHRCVSALSWLLVLLVLSSCADSGTNVSASNGVQIQSPSSFVESQSTISSFTSRPPAAAAPSVIELSDTVTLEFIYATWEDITAQSPLSISQSARILEKNGFLYYLAREGGVDSVCRLDLEAQTTEVMVETQEKTITSFLPLSETKMLILYELRPQEIEVIDPEHPSLFSDGPLPSQLFVFDMKTGQQQSIDKTYDVPLLPVYSAATVAGNIFYGRYCILPSGEVTQYPESWELIFDSNTLYGYDAQEQAIFLADKDASHAIPILKVTGAFPVIRDNKAYFFLHDRGEAVSKLLVADIEARRIEKNLTYHWPHSTEGFRTEIIAHAGGYHFLDKTVSDDVGIRPEFTSIQLTCYDLDANIAYAFPAFTQVQPVYGIDYTVLGGTVYYLVEDRSCQILNLDVLYAM